MDVPPNPSLPSCSKHKMSRYSGLDTGSCSAHHFVVNWGNPQSGWIRVPHSCFQPFFINWNSSLSLWDKSGAFLGFPGEIKSGAGPAWTAFPTACEKCVQGLCTHPALCPLDSGGNSFTASIWATWDSQGERRKKRKTVPVAQNTVQEGKQTSCNWQRKIGEALQIRQGSCWWPYQHFEISSFPQISVSALVQGNQNTIFWCLWGNQNTFGENSFSNAKLEQSTLKFSRGKWHWWVPTISCPWEYFTFTFAFPTRKTKQKPPQMFWKKDHPEVFKRKALHFENWLLKLLV